MLSLYPAFPEEFDTETPLLVSIDGLDVPLYCERFERRGTSGAVASFADFDTERRAQELVGLEFRIECDEDEDDEFYLEDLIGFAVTCTEAGADGAKGAAAFTGSVTDYYDSDANPLFELEIGGRTVLVPAAEESVRRRTLADLTTDPAGAVDAIGGDLLSVRVVAVEHLLLSPSAGPGPVAHPAPPRERP